MSGLRIIPAATGLLALFSCGSETSRGIQEVRARQPVSGGIRWNVPPAERFLLRGTPAGPMFAWDLPDGWVEMPASQLRQADFRIAGAPEVECYLSAVMGGAPANLNRWRRQMGLPAYSAADLQALEKRPFLGTEAYYVEMEGTFSGMEGAPQEDFLLAGLVLDAGGQTLTLKFIGPAAQARGELQRFRALSESFRLGTSASPHGAMGPAPGPGPGPGSGALGWKAPEGWRQAPPRQMVDVAFDVGEGTACWVSILGSDGGGIDPNIQRWQGEMGGAPVSAREPVAMLGTQGTLIEIHGSYRGSSAVPPIPEATMLAVICGAGAQTVFVKMIGPRAEVQAHRQQFLEFCASLGE